MRFRRIYPTVTHQVSKRKQKHPDDIHKVPVETGDPDPVISAALMQWRAVAVQASAGIADANK